MGAETGEDYLVIVFKYEEGRSAFVTEDGGAGVTEVGVDELSRYYSVTEKSLS